jgi:Protein of unknown function (DUF4031)
MIADASSICGGGAGWSARKSTREISDGQSDRLRSGVCDSNRFDSDGVHMSVYVDDMRAPYGRMIMCHMWADSLEELLAMVDKIGVQRRWLQKPPKASWVHFDIALEKKRLAIENGAILTDRYGPVEHVARLRGDQAKIDLIAKLRARNNVPA